MLVVTARAVQAEGGACAARGRQEAAKRLGWRFILIDRQGNPSKVANAVQQAINVNAYGIALQAVDAGTILDPLKEAKKTGIAVAAFAGIDQDGVLDATTL